MKRLTKSLLALGIALATAAAQGAEIVRLDEAELAKARAELDRARSDLRDATRRIAELSAKVGESQGNRAYAFEYLMDEKRAMIGVVFGADERGAIVSAVTPGGPAEKAGLRAGD